MVEPFMPKFTSKAQTACDDIASNSQRFARGCEQDGEVAVIMADDGYRQFHLFRIKELSPEMILLVGETDDGKHVEAVMHYSAIRVSMIAMPKSEGEPKRLGIGFNADHRES